MHQIHIKEGPKTSGYQTCNNLRTMVESVLENIPKYIREFTNRTIWMIHSTAIGGGVANILNPSWEFDQWAFNSQTREVGPFTLFSQIGAWLELFRKLVTTS